MNELICPECNKPIQGSANFCSNCGFELTPSSPSENGTASTPPSPAEGTDIKPSTAAAIPLSWPLSIFGLIVFIPTVFDILNWESFFDSAHLGLGLDIPTTSKVLLISDSLIRILILLFCLGTLISLYGRRKELRLFAISLLILVPLRFMYQVLIAIYLKDHELTEFAFPGLALSIAVALVWIPYFAFSPRVKEIVKSSR